MTGFTLFDGRRGAPSQNNASILALHGCDTESTIGREGHSAGEVLTVDVLSGVGITDSNNNNLLPPYPVQTYILQGVSTQH